jgi:hypothetical protein
MRPDPDPVLMKHWYPSRFSSSSFWIFYTIFPCTVKVLTVSGMFFERLPKSLPCALQVFE